MSRGPSQLTLTRIVCVLLIGASSYFWYRAFQAQEEMEFLRQRANWLYPYVPNLGTTNFRFTMDFYGMTYKGTYKDDFEVLFSGAPEKPDLYLSRDIAKALDKPDSVYIDVGANKGLHSLFLSKHFNHVIAYEPVPDLVASIEEMLELNQLTNVAVRPVGLGKENAVVPFFQGGNTLTGSFRDDFNEKQQRFEFEVKIGDEEMARLNAVPDLIKVDVEGFEIPVLQGFEKTLQTARPVVLMELLPETLQDKKYGFEDEASLTRLFPDDYVFYTFDTYEVYSGEYTLTPFDYEARKRLQAPNMFVYPRNIVALPKDKVALIPKDRLIGR